MRNLLTEGYTLFTASFKLKSRELSKLVLGQGVKGADISQHPILSELIPFENEFQLSKAQLESVYLAASDYTINIILLNMPLFKQLLAKFVDLYDPMNLRKVVTVEDLKTIFNKYAKGRFKVKFSDKPGIYNGEQGIAFTVSPLQRLDPDTLKTKAKFLNDRIWSAIRYFGTSTSIKFTDYINNLAPPIEPAK